MSRDPYELSRREREVMEIVYRLREATLSEILQSLQNPPNRSSLRSTLGILEEKGCLEHAKRGREFVFSPTTPTQSAGRNALHRVLLNFFDNSLTAAVAAHFAHPKERVSEKDVAELRALVDQLAQESKSKKS